MKIIRDDSSYGNELEKMAKFNKKHQKGWGWFVNPKASINIKLDAGNVPLNNDIFNSSMGQGTSDGACGNVTVAEDLLQDKIIELDNGVEIHLTPKIVEGSSFILPDGLFVDLEGDTHGGFDYWCAKENVKNPFENKRNIKVNDATNEYDNMPYPYIEIQDKPTQAQYNSLLEWLDHLVRLGKEEVQFKNKSYSLYDNIPEDIVKNIKRYFTSGVLYEGNGDNLTPKTPRQPMETNLFMTDKNFKELILSMQEAGHLVGTGKFVDESTPVILDLIDKKKPSKPSEKYNSIMRGLRDVAEMENQPDVIKEINASINNKSSNKGTKMKILKESYKYDCYFKDNYIGTVEANDEEEAYSKMEQKWPELPYGEYDGVAEVIKVDENLNEKLIQSDSDRAFRKNVQTELDAGKPMKQALAIAYSVKEKNRMKKEDLDSLDFYEVKFKLRDKDTEEEFEEKETLSEEDFNSIPDMEEYLKSIYDDDKVEVVEVLGIEPINKNINEGKKMKKDLFKHLDIEEVIGWISEHDYLYRDFKNEFGYEFDEASGEEKNIPSLEDTIEWLQGEGDTAWEDFKLYFNINESLNEEYIPDITRVINNYDLDIVTKEDMGNDYYYWKLFKTVEDTEKFNYHSDYWGDADEYQEHAVDVMSDLEDYIGDKVKIHLDDEGDLTCKVIGLLVDRQYNKHLKLLVEFEEDKKEESLNEEAKKSDSLVTEIKKAIRDYYSDFNDEDYKDFVEDYTAVEVVPAFDKDMYKVEVRMEIGYDSFMELIEDKLDPIIRKYDKEAYFDMEDAGIANAFIPKNALMKEELEDDSEEKPLEEDKEITFTTIEAKWSPEANAYIIPKEEWEDWD